MTSREREIFLSMRDVWLVAQGWMSGHEARCPKRIAASLTADPWDSFQEHYGPSAPSSDWLSFDFNQMRSGLSIAAAAVEQAECTCLG